MGTIRLNSWTNLARRALLIGNATFDHPKEFQNLRTPVNNVQDFAGVLQEHCDFDSIVQVLEQPAENVRKAVVDFFHELEKGDLTLFYYCGHGYRDKNDKYFLSAKDSHPDNLMISAIRETFIHDVMSESRATHFIIILDSCFSGAFLPGPGQMGVTTPVSLRELKGAARIVLASSDRVEPSFEGEDNGRNSLFTRYLIEGITTGLADRDGDGRISIEELFYYAEPKVRLAIREQSNYVKQTPLMELGVRECEVFIVPQVKTRGQDAASALSKGQDYTFVIKVADSGQPETTLRLSFEVSYAGQVQERSPEIICPISPNKPWQAIFDSPQAKQAELVTSLTRALEAVKKYAVYLRLLLDISHPQAQQWAWEQLTLPGETQPLCLRENLEFARMLQTDLVERKQTGQSQNWKPSILCAIASDKKLLKAHRLPRLDQPEAQQGLTGIFRLHKLAHYVMTEEHVEHVTLEKIRHKLDTGRFNILHLRSYGAIPHAGHENNATVSHVLLAEASTADSEQSALTTIETISDLLPEGGKTDQPQIVILDLYPKDEQKNIVCKLGCVLPHKNVPALLTICSRLTLEQRNNFMAAFYHELADGSGRVGVAVTAGRRVLAEQSGKNDVGYPFPILYADAQINVCFETDPAKGREFVAAENTVWTFPPQMSNLEADQNQYEEQQITSAGLKRELSEELLDKINQSDQSDQANYIVLYSRPLFGRTATLHQLHTKQLRFFAAGMSDRVPLYLDCNALDPATVTTLSVEPAWQILLKNELFRNYGAPLPVLPEAKFPEQPLCLILLDNVHCLPDEAIQALYTLITRPEQRVQRFVLTSLTAQLEKLKVFQPQQHGLELQGLPALENLPRTHPVHRLWEHDYLQDLASCPAIRNEFNAILTELDAQQEPYTPARLLEKWLMGRIQPLFVGPQSHVFQDRLLVALEELSHAGCEQGVFTFSRPQIEQCLSARLDETTRVEQALTGLEQQALLQPPEDERGAYAFTDPVLPAFLTARYYARRLNALAPSEEPPALLKICQAQHELQGVMFELLLDMVTDRAILKTIVEQLLFDALRTDNLTLAARVVNKKPLAPNPDYDLDARIKKLVFLTLLERFASGNAADREHFVAWMRVEKITQQIPENLLVRCSPEAYEMLQKLLASAEARDVTAALQILRWVTNDQSLPLLLTAPLHHRELHKQVLSTRKHWLSQNFVSWLKELTPEDQSQARVRLKEMTAHGVLSQDVSEALLAVIASSGKPPEH